MKRILKLRAALAAIFLATSAACSPTAAETQALPQQTSDVDAAIAEMFAEGSGSSSDRPDFTNETVLKLNPIVARSKAALDRFDELKTDMASAQEAGDKARIATIAAEFATLKTNADAAHGAFMTEKKALLARNEYYNEVVLDAMEQFVAEAPEEIAEELARSVR